VKNALKKLVPSKLDLNVSKPSTISLLFNFQEILAQLDLSNSLLWDLIGLLTQISENVEICALVASKFQVIPCLSKLLHAALSSAQSTKVMSLLSLLRVLVVDLEVIRREAYLPTLLSDLSALLTDTGVMNITSGSEFTTLVLFILSHLCRRSYLATKILISIMSLSKLTSLTFISSMDQLYAECLCFYMRRVNLSKSLPEEGKVRDYLSRLTCLFVSSVSVDDIHTMRLIYFFIKDLQQDPEYRSVISSQDSTREIQQVLLALDFNDEFNPSTSEVVFSFLVEVANGYQTDHVGLLDAIIKFSNARLDSKPLTKLVSTFELVKAFVAAIDFNSSSLSSAEEKNLKLLVDQLLPSLNSFGSGKLKDRDFCQTFLACLRTLQVIAGVPGWCEGCGQAIKAGKFQLVYSLLLQENRSQQAVLTTEFLSLALQLGEFSGPWMKVAQEMAGDRSMVNMVAEALKTDAFSREVLKKALAVLSRVESPEVYFLPSTDQSRPVAEVAALPTPAEQTRGEEVDSLLARVGAELERAPLDPVLDSVYRLAISRGVGHRLETECIKQSLAAADKRLQYQELALEQKESLIRNMDQVVRDLSSSLATAREELSDIRLQHGDLSKEADTTRDRLGRELEVVREQLVKEAERREQGEQRAAKTREVNQQLKEDLELYKTNQDKLQEKLKQEMKGREEVSATLGKKLKKKEQQLEEEMGLRERAEKEGEELRKQVGNMEQVSKRQSHVLSKRDKELAEVKEELANMKKIHDQIFNLSTKARGSAAC